MPWDGNGNFTREHDWTDDANSAIDIEASRMDTEHDNFSVGINACLTLNGENTATQINVDNLRMDGNTLSSTDVNGNVVIDPNGTGTFDVNSSRITSVSAGTGATDAATIGGAETLTNKTLTAPNMTSPSIGGVAMTSTAAELNQLDGATITAAQLNAVAALSANELATNDISAKCTLFDDFQAIVLDVSESDIESDHSWSTFQGSSVASAFIATGFVNGKVRLNFAANAAGTFATNGIIAFSNGIFQADQGSLVFEARISVTSITDVAVFVGLSNISTSLMPFTLGGSDALTSNVSNGVGFLFDTAADTDNIWLVGVDDSADATHQDTGQALVAGTDITLRFTLTAAGAADFFINGTSVGTQMSGAVDPSTLLSVNFGGFARAAATKRLDVDYMYTQQDR